MPKQLSVGLYRESIFRETYFYTISSRASAGDLGLPKPTESAAAATPVNPWMSAPGAIEERQSQAYGIGGGDQGNGYGSVSSSSSYQKQQPPPDIPESFLRQQQQQLQQQQQQQAQYPRPVESGAGAQGCYVILGSFSFST